MKRAINKKVLFMAIFVTVAAQFVWDMTAPNGLADWVWYFIPIYLSIYFGQRFFSYLLASLISLLIIIGFYSSPQGIDPQLAIIARLMGIAVIWLMCVIIAHYKHAEKNRQQIDRAMNTVSECNQVLVRTSSEPELLKRVCGVLVENGGYRMCWVGFAQNDERKSVQVAAYAGCEEGYLEKAQITWSDQDERGQGPTGLAIRQGETVICNDFQNDKRTAAWWVEGRKRGYFSSITIPLVNQDHNFGVLVLYAWQRNAFPPEELRLLRQLADDLAYGICSLRTRAEQLAAEKAAAHSLNQLRLSTEATGIGLWEWDVRTNKIQWDGQMFQIYGVAPTPDLTVDYAVWRNAVLPEDLAQQEAELQATVRDGVKSRRIFRILRANDGACRYIETVETIRRNSTGEINWVLGTNIDVTDRMMADEALRKSRNQLQFLLFNTPAIIYSLRTKPDPVTTFISPNVENILGHPPEKFTKDAGFWFAHLHPDDTAKAEEDFHTADATGRVLREYRFRHADGSYRWMRDEMGAVHTRDGKPDEYVGHWLDITEQKLAEELRRKSEAQFESLFARHSACKLIIDPATGGIRNANEAAVKFYGWPLAKLRQMCIQNISTAADGEVEKRLVYMANHGVGRFESRHRRADGSERDVEVFSTAIDTNGEILLYSINIDITEKKKAEMALKAREEIFSSIVNQAGDAIGLVDVETMRFIEFNEAAHTMLGYTREEFTGFGPQNIEGQFTPEEVRKKFKLIVNHEKAVFETKHRHRNGELRDIRVSARLIQIQGKSFISAIWSDITEGKRKAIELRKLSLAVEQNPASIVITDPRGNIEYVNHRFTEVTGYTLDELRGQNPRILKSGQHQAAVYVELWREINAGRDWRGELVNRKKDGSFHTELVIISPVKNEAGGITHFVAMKEDITAAKKMSAELETQRRFLLDLVENSMLQIFVKDREGRYLMVNRSFEIISNRKRAETLGRTDVELFGEVDGGQFRAHDLTVMTSGQSQMLEEVLSGENGHKRTFISTKFPVRNESGEISGIAAMVLEITDRMQAETQAKRLATAVEQSGETIVITDTEGTILYANPAFEKTTGYTRAEAIGKNPRLLKSGKQDDRFYREMWDVLARGETWKGHFFNQRKDGKLYEEDATISPIRDEHGKIINYVAAKRDVTREVQLEAQFRQAQKMEAMGTLAGGIAHDFNNILTVIFGYGYMLQLVTKKNPEVHEKVEEILLAANRAKDLVQQILTFSRQHEQERQVIRLDSVIKEATKFLRASLPAHIQVEMKLAADSPVVLADPTQIYQVTMNLATNAMHAMEGRQGLLTIQLAGFTPDEKFIETHPKLRPIRYTRLTIADTGHGMDAKTLERIYEPFFTTKPVGKGTGLGLAVVHGIIQSHDGVITVESQVGHGTTFDLYFPAQTVDQPLAAAGAHELPMGQDQKILIVDDEVAVATMLQKMLKLLNFHPTVCNRPGEAMALIQKNPGQFDLVITDLTMPEMNGLDLARQIRTDCPDMPIILVSGFTSTLTQDNLKEAGICRLLVKPVAMTELAEALQQQLATSANSR